MYATPEILRPEWPYRSRGGRRHRTAFGGRARIPAGVAPRLRPADARAEVEGPAEVGRFGSAEAAAGVRRRKRSVLPQHAPPASQWREFSRLPRPLLARLPCPAPRASSWRESPRLPRAVPGPPWRRDFPGVPRPLPPPAPRVPDRGRRREGASGVPRSGRRRGGRRLGQASRAVVRCSTRSWSSRRSRWTSSSPLSDQPGGSSAGIRSKISAMRSR